MPAERERKSSFTGFRFQSIPVCLAGPRKEDKVRESPYAGWSCRKRCAQTGRNPKNSSTLRREGSRSPKTRKKMRTWCHWWPAVTGAVGRSGGE